MRQVKPTECDRLHDTKSSTTFIRTVGDATYLAYLKFLDAVSSTFPTEPRFFNAAERCNGIRHDAGIDTRHPDYRPLET